MDKMLTKYLTYALWGVALGMIIALFILIMVGYF